MTHLRSPLHFDVSGRTATADDRAHLRGLIEQVLFTRPGERVCRPDFGCGLGALVFDAGDELVAAARLLAQAALQQWLGDHIDVEAVDVEVDEAVLRVTVEYTVRRSGARVAAEFTRIGGAR